MTTHEAKVADLVAAAQAALDILDEPLQARSQRGQIARAKNTLRAVLSGFKRGGPVPGEGFVWVRKQS